MRSCVADRRVHAVNQKSLRRAGKLSAAHFFLLHPSFHACTESFCFQYARLSYLLVYCCEERKINWKDSCLKRSTQREKLNETLDGSTQKFDKKCERILWSKRVVFCRLWEIARIYTILKIKWILTLSSQELSLKIADFLGTSARATICGAYSLINFFETLKIFQELVIMMICIIWDLILCFDYSVLLRQSW